MVELPANSGAQGTQGLWNDPQLKMPSCLSGNKNDIFRRPSLTMLKVLRVRRRSGACAKGG